MKLKYSQAISAYEHHCQVNSLEAYHFNQRDCSHASDGWHLVCGGDLIALVQQDVVLMGKELVHYHFVIAANAEAFRLKTLPELKAHNGVK